jgi:hypothetical protein
MAVNSIFIIDSASFETATAVYLDQALTHLAPDGYYSFGTIVRQQSGGILLAAETCAECPTPCGNSIGTTGGQGIYQVNLDTGNSIGAIVIKFSPQGIPDGIRVTYDGVVYNKLSSPVDGLHQSTNPGNFTLVGNIGGDCGMTGNTTVFPSLIEYLYIGTSFVATGNTQSITVLPGDVSLGTSNPGFCVMVIPKTTSAPNDVLIEMLGPCSGTAWDLSTICPEPLPSFSGSLELTVPSIEVPCSTPINQTYYWAKVNTTTLPYPKETDYIFLDENGEFPLPDGRYLIIKDSGNNIVIIDVVDGIVIDNIFTTCI